MGDLYSIQQRKAWFVLAQTWVDTSYDDNDLDGFARQLIETGLPYNELERIAYWEVCGSFALFSLAAVLTCGMALPDWYFSEEDVLEKTRKWLKRPLLYSLANPFWLIGYLMSRLLMLSTMGPVLSRVQKSGEA